MVEKREDLDACWQRLSELGKGGELVIWRAATGQMAKNGWHQPVQQGTRPLPPCGGNPASHPAIKRGTDITRPLESMLSKPLHELLGVIKQQVFTVALAGDAGLLGVLEKFVRGVRADGPHHAGKHGKEPLAVFMAEELDELHQFGLAAWQ